jgi:hypothetical protein
MPFNLSSCPTWWIEANWANWTPDLRWEFIRWLDSWRWVDPSRTLKSSQAATRVFYSESDEGGRAWRQVDMFWYAWIDYDWAIELAFSRPTYHASLATAGTSTNALSYWIRVRPRNVALLYCVKQ